MTITIQREVFTSILQLAAGAVEKKSHMPIMSNILLNFEGDFLKITGSDLETEITAQEKLSTLTHPLRITVPCDKLINICKSLPEKTDIKFSLEDNNLYVRNGRSKFKLNTLPADDYPNIEEYDEAQEVLLTQSQLKRLLDRTQFAMAHQDVRFYLNGMLWAFDKNRFTTVCTDGHRLAKCDLLLDKRVEKPIKIIVPGKAIHELSKLISYSSEPITLLLSEHDVKVKTSKFTFISKLVDGKYPDYERVIPKDCVREIVSSREELRYALNRAAILSNDKVRSVLLSVNGNAMKIVANNLEQEQAEEDIAVSYEGGLFEIGFNYEYIVDVLSVLQSKNVMLRFNELNIVLIEEVINSEDNSHCIDDSTYVISPMRI